MSWEARWYGPRRALTWALLPASWVYGLGSRLWHLAWDSGLRRPVKLEGAQVISVGNLVVGGAGKTPVVILLAQEALARGQRVAVLTRGYGRAGRAPRRFDATALPPVDEVGDEPRLIARRCPGVTVWVGADRVESARQAVAAGAQVLLLDDGFQHRRLARDVDLLLDGGDDNGLLLPAGPLREPATARRRATEVWRRGVDVHFEVTGVRPPGGAALPETELPVTELPETELPETELPVTALPVTALPVTALPVTELPVTELPVTALPVTALRGQPVVLLLGVARPARVAASVEALGARVVAVHAYGDHHRFSAEELERAISAARAAGAWLLTTEKDAERLPEGSAHVLLYAARRGAPLSS